jgi:hypothetical protein
VVVGFTCRAASCFAQKSVQANEKSSPLKLNSAARSRQLDSTSVPFSGALFGQRGLPASVVVTPMR